MSETESWQGKLVPVDLEGLTNEEWMKKELDRPLPDYYDNWAEFFADENYRNYYYHYPSETLYKIEATRFDAEGFVIGVKEGENYTFMFSYYNGGASFDEMLEEVINKAAELDNITSPTSSNMVTTIEDLQKLGYGSIIQEEDDAPKILLYSEWGDRWWQDPMHQTNSYGDSWIELPVAVLYRKEPDND